MPVWCDHDDDSSDHDEYGVHDEHPAAEHVPATAHDDLDAAVYGDRGHLQDAARLLLEAMSAGMVEAMAERMPRQQVETPGRDKPRDVCYPNGWLSNAAWKRQKELRR